MMSADRSLGIYVHIPFCIRKCNYCDFCSFPSGDEEKSAYVSALTKNIHELSDKFSDRIVDSIFFGGGTPTCLNADQLCSILETIKCHYNVDPDAEITTECNPATADYTYMASLKSGGFNRLSLGVQSANDNELKLLGRLHNFSDFEKTYNSAIRSGFSNINLDIMFGIPDQTEASFENTLRKIISLSPTHISAYSLKIEPNTRFYKERASLTLPGEDSEYNMYKQAYDILGQNGYGHYEISNYAMAGFESKHNLKYWNCDDYIGFGISAHSCIGRNRYSTISSIDAYIGSILQNNYSDIYSLEESLSPESFSEEYIMMRMRLRDGLSKDEYYQKFSHPLNKKYIDRMSRFIKSGHIINSDNRYCFSLDGMYISNYILSEILDLE